jgi:hypothetical protein
MDDLEFRALHAASEVLMQSYFDEVRKSSDMLAECTAEPLPIEKRLTLLSQGIIEHEAHVTYVSSKGVLLDAALLGYGLSN